MRYVMALVVCAVIAMAFASYGQRKAAVLLPLTIAGDCPVQATPGTPYHCVLQAVGGTPPFDWSLTAGSLPAWAHWTISTVNRPGDTFTITGQMPPPPPSPPTALSGKTGT